MSNHISRRDLCIGVIASAAVKVLPNAEAQAAHAVSATEFDLYVGKMLRGIADSLDVPYEQMAADFLKVNAA